MSNATAQATHAVRSGVIRDRRICTLSSHDTDTQVSFVPELGMLACSMLHAGEERPGQRSEAPAAIRGPLEDRTFDDGFVLADRAGSCSPAVAAGFEVVFGDGCPYAQVVAPPDDDVVCFQPMTAPTDALRGCLGPPPSVSPGDCSRARFTITVKRAT